VWTTAGNVGDVVKQLGLDRFGIVVNPPLTARIPMDTAHISIGLPDTLVIRHQQWRTTIVTAAPTVGQALQQAGFRLTRHDYVSVAPSTPLTHRTTVTVARVRGGQDLRRVSLPFKTLTQYDAALAEGQSQVVRPGRTGLALARVTRQSHAGQVTRHRTVLRVLRAPVNEIVRVGTDTSNAATPVSGTSGLTSSGLSREALNWAALAQCESGGNPRAVNPYGYYGLYQFALSTWYGVGGTGNPTDASPSEQTYRAQLLYARSGSAPWPVCGALLYS
jgi:resuscitation-promoting factor RpfB